MFCNNCGAKNSNNSNFCSKCGEKMVKNGEIVKKTGNNNHLSFIIIGAVLALLFLYLTPIIKLTATRYDASENRFLDDSRNIEVLISFNNSTSIGNGYYRYENIKQTLKILIVLESGALIALIVLSARQQTKYLLRTSVINLGMLILMIAVINAMWARKEWIYNSEYNIYKVNLTPSLIICSIISVGLILLILKKIKNVDFKTMISREKITNFFKEYTEMSAEEFARIYSRKK